MVPTSTLLLATLFRAHPNPANLDTLDCAVSDLGVEFASARFPNDAAGVAAALHSAFHLDECQNHSAVVATATEGPQRGGYSARLAGPEAAVTSIYVSALNGSDASGDGTRARPFQSLHKVQSVVRKTPSASRPATTVFLRTGTYYLGRTLTLTTEDSGVIWSAFPGETVTISGGIPLSTAASPLTWSPLSTVPNTTAYKAALPTGAPLNFSMLFVDDERAIWARYPNGNNKEQSGMCYSKTQRPIEAAHPCNGYAKATGTTVPRPSPKPRSADLHQAIGRYGDYPDFDIMVGGVSQSQDPQATGYTYADLFAAPGGLCLNGSLATGVLNCTPVQPCTVPCSVPGSRKWFAHFDRMQSQSDTFSYDKTHWTNQTWAHPGRATVRFLGQPIWGSHAYPLLSMDQDKGTIQLGPGGWQFADIGAVGKGNNFYVEGILEEVDSSFEWAIDYETRSLHYFPNQTMPAPPPAPSPAPGPSPSPAPGPIPVDSFLIELAGKPQCSLAHAKVPCCLDLGWWSHAPGAAFSMNNCHPHNKGNNQLFTATPALAPGTYSQLKIALNGFCLTQGGCKGQGCPPTGGVSASPCKVGGSADQLWSVDVATGALKSKEGACLHARAAVHDGSNLITSTCNSTDPNQKFTVSKQQPQHSPQPYTQQQEWKVGRQQAVPTPTLVEAAILQRLVQVLGESATNPARNIAFRGVRFAHAATTQLERYEVPSGGDWAIARTGAVFIENAEHIEVSDSFFDSVGGNGVFLSKYVRNCTVTGNRFAFPGDSAVASVGVSNLADGTAQTYPAFNTIANNWMHDIGTFGKQTSCYFQAVSGRNSIINNTCYNGPRAGINFNDGFLGGSLVEGNLIANMVRETGDHGPFNSWDRTPYNTRRDDGSTSTVPLPNTVTRNMIINGYNGVWSLDHDDGSSYYNDSSNFLVYGGCKNYKGDHKICGPDNVIIYPGIDGRSSGARSCQTNDNPGFKFNEFIGNKCVQGDGQFYTFSGNKADQAADPFTANNTFYSDGAKFDFAGGLAKMQAAGLDLGSTVHEVPSIEEIVEMGRLALGPPEA